MKKRIVSILAVLALCLTMLPMAAFAVDPFANYEVGDPVILDNKEYTYLGDITETGMELSEWTVEVEEDGTSGIYKAGEGYVSYSVEEGLAYITLNNATIRNMSEEAFEGYGILVSDYDVAIHGIGTNVIEAGNTAIEVAGCLTMTGEFQRIAGMSSGIYCSAVYGFGEEEVTVDGGELMINANVAEIVGTEVSGVYSDGNLFINGSLQDVSGGSGIATSGDLTISGNVGAVKGFAGSALSARGDLTIAEGAKVGNLTGANYGIYVSCQMDEEGEYPVSLSKVAINGIVGDIVCDDQTDENGEEYPYIHYGILVLGGDLTINGTVNSIQSGDYGVWVEGGQFKGEKNITGGIESEVPVTTVEWPSNWAHVEVMDAILWDLVPVELQGKYTQATTRAEYCALATSLYEAVTGEGIELADEELVPFTDSEDVNVAKMAKVGVVNGMGDGTFAPNAKLTREQAATMLSRLAYAVGESLAASAPDFTDNGKISDWAYDAVGQVQAAEIMKGMGDGTFAPQGNYTREQSILTMDRLFNMVFWDE